MVSLCLQPRWKQYSQCWAVVWQRLHQEWAPIQHLRHSVWMYPPHTLCHIAECSSSSTLQPCHPLPPNHWLHWCVSLPGCHGSHCLHIHCFQVWDKGVWFPESAVWDGTLPVRGGIRLLLKIEHRFGSSIGLRPPRRMLSPSTKLEKLTQDSKIVRAKKNDKLNGHQMRPPTHLLLFLVTASILPST
jgi:hypothetical protein